MGRSYAHGLPRPGRSPADGSQAKGQRAFFPGRPAARSRRQEGIAKRRALAYTGTMDRQHSQQQEILHILEQTYGGSQSALHFADPFQLLVAVILSAQTNDNQVNKITGPLFAEFPDAAALAALEPEELEPRIATCGLYKNKAKNIVATSRILCRDYGGRVPREKEALMALPGVGRKTANVVQAVGFGIPALAVDSHVQRVSNRLGLVDNEKEPVKIERQLRSILPPEKTNNFCHRLVLHGRAVCTARKTFCEKCCCAPFCKTLNR